MLLDFWWFWKEAQTRSTAREKMIQTKPHWVWSLGYAFWQTFAKRKQFYKKAQKCFMIIYSLIVYLDVLVNYSVMWIPSKWVASYLHLWTNKSSDISCWKNSVGCQVCILQTLYSALVNLDQGFFTILLTLSAKGLLFKCK